MTVFFLITEYPGLTVVVQTRDRSEHGPEGHQVAHRITVFGLGCCSPYVNSAVAKARTQDGHSSWSSFTTRPKQLGSTLTVFVKNIFNFKVYYGNIKFGGLKWKYLPLWRFFMGFSRFLLEEEPEKSKKSKSYVFILDVGELWWRKEEMSSRESPFTVIIRQKHHKSDEKHVNMNILSLWKIENILCQIRLFGVSNLDILKSVIWIVNIYKIKDIIVFWKKIV